MAIAKVICGRAIHAPFIDNRARRSVGLDFLEEAWDCSVNLMTSFRGLARGKPSVRGSLDGVQVVVRPP